MSLRLLQAPAETPVSLAEAKAHCRVDHDTDDDLIELYITAAVSHLDGAGGSLGRCLVTQEWAVDLDEFPDEISLPLAPLQSVDAVKYLDASGDTQTVNASTYVQKHGVVSLASGASWPEPLDQAGAVWVEFTAGYGAAEDVPAPIKAAILLMVGHWYANREAVAESGMQELPMAVKALTMPFFYRVGV